MEIAPENLPWQSVYNILVGSVVPRPIGWISTVDSAGRPNLAPFSFFNAVCPNPPHVLFCPNVRITDRQTKDSLHNVRATGEFVVNIVTEDLAEAMNLTATELPAEVNEFEFGDLLISPSKAVLPPRVAASPIHYECKVAQIFDLGDQPGAGSVVIGKVLHIHVDESVLFGGDKVDVAKLKPIGRIGGNGYCRVTDLFKMVRPPSQIKVK